MKLKEEELDKIDGGALTSTMLNAITAIVRVLYEAGIGVGSSIRRIESNTICTS